MKAFRRWKQCLISQIKRRKLLAEVVFNAKVFMAMKECKISVQQKYLLEWEKLVNNRKQRMIEASLHAKDKQRVCCFRIWQVFQCVLFSFHMINNF